MGTGSSKPAKRPMLGAGGPATGYDAARRAAGWSSPTIDVVRRFRSFAPTREGGEQVVRFEDVCAAVGLDRPSSERDALYLLFASLCGVDPAPAPGGRVEEDPALVLTLREFADGIARWRDAAERSSPHKLHGMCFDVVTGRGGNLTPGGVARMARLAYGDAGPPAGLRPPASLLADVHAPPGRGGTDKDSAGDVPVDRDVFCRWLDTVVSSEEADSRLQSFRRVLSDPSASPGAGDFRQG